MVTTMSAGRSAALRSAPYTYADVGATAADALPPGYHHLTATATVDHHDFEAVKALLMTWQAHERSGLQVEASSQHAEAGAVVLMRFRRVPAVVRIPCRVVYVVDEPDRAGFAYGTLPGHPEAGEELFLVRRRGSGDVIVSIVAFSRPATTLARVGGPATRAMQRQMTQRYLRALGGGS